MLPEFTFFDILFVQSLWFPTYQSLCQSPTTGFAALTFDSLLLCIDLCPLTPLRWPLTTYSAALTFVSLLLCT